MFSLAHCKKNPEKIEGMASWLILGGVIPLAAALLQLGLPGLARGHFWSLLHQLYLALVLAGALSLCVRRAGTAWRLLVALAALLALAPAILALQEFSPAAFGTWLWSALTLWFIAAQYRFDRKRARAASDAG